MDETDFASRALDLFERLTCAMERIATAFEAPDPKAAPPDERFEADRDDEKVPEEIIAAIEQLEAQGEQVPDEVYKHYGIEPPERNAPQLDESVFDLDQSILNKPAERSHAKEQASIPFNEDDAESQPVSAKQGITGIMGALPWNQKPGQTGQTS